MRIAYLLTSLGIGGAERQVVDLAQRMSARGHAVVIVVLREPEAEEWPTALDVIHLHMRKTPEDMGDGLVRAWRVLRAFRPQLLHSHTFPANMTARALRLLGATPAVITTIHNNREGLGLRRWVYRATDAFCAHTTAVSANAAERFVASGSVLRRKCSVLANAIDESALMPDLQRRSAKREELGARKDFVWLAAGRVVPEKDYPNLMRAFAIVEAERRDVQLWVAGASPENAAAAGADRAMLLSEPGTTNGRVHWLGLRRDMPGLLDAADGFVLSSASEGMPLVIGEAMAMEKPVVATDVGGVRELMGQTGSIVSARNPAALAHSMLAVMLETKEDRAKTGHAARARIVERFSMNTKAEEWEQLYRSVVDRNRAPSARNSAW